jgi:hypothetical protein
VTWYKSKTKGAPKMKPQCHSNLGRAAVRRSAVLAVTSVALAALTFAWSPATASACTCPTPLSATEAFAGAVVVFEGVARGKAMPAAGVLDPATHVPAVKQAFEVSRRWKGDVPATVDVLTAERVSSCGQSYLTDAHYIVYVGRDDGGHFWDDSCSRTRLVAMAAGDLAGLGPGLPPVPSAGATDAGTTDASGGGEDSGGCTVARGRRPCRSPVTFVVLALGLVAFARRRRALSGCASPAQGRWGRWEGAGRIPCVIVIQEERRMNIRDVVSRLDELDEALTIFAKRPWTANAEVMLCPHDNDDEKERARAAGFDYFLEISIAKDEVLEPLRRTDIDTRLKVLLFYAENDAFPDEADLRGGDEDPRQK